MLCSFRWVVRQNAKGDLGVMARRRRTPGSSPAGAGTLALSAGVLARRVHTRVRPRSGSRNNEVQSRFPRRSRALVWILLSGFGCEVHSAEHVAYLNAVIRKEFLSPSPLCGEVLRVCLPSVDGREGIELGHHEKLAVLGRKSFRETNPGIMLTSATICWFNAFSCARSACGFTCVQKTTIAIAVPLRSSVRYPLKTRNCFTPLEVPRRPHA